MQLMINQQTNIGDLVYIPSQALLTEQSGPDGYKKFIKTDKPINVLCVDRKRRNKGLLQWLILVGQQEISISD